MSDQEKVESERVESTEVKIQTPTPQSPRPGVTTEQTEKVTETRTTDK